MSHLNGAKESLQSQKDCPFLQREPASPPRKAMASGSDVGR